jgi:homoserine dehydrogenase
MHLRLASLGFGNVGRALAIMLAEKADDLQRRYDLTFSFTGAFTRSAGGWIAPGGVSPAALAASKWPKGGSAVMPVVGNWPAGELPPPVRGDPREHLAMHTSVFAGGAVEFVRTCPADVVLELTALNPQTGQPAIDHIRAALIAGKHVVTANKGPIAYAYRALRALAQEHGVALRFESTVMDGTPIFGMAQAALPATVITGFRGLLNSTSNYVLSRMAQGESLEAAIAGAQRLGIAEANPSNDLEGWDGAVKATVLANVLMDADLRPADVLRDGLGAEAMRLAREALGPGQTLKQVVEASRDKDGVSARVRLVALGADDLLAHLSGMETALLLHTDTMRDLTIVEGEGGPGQTAFGVVADLVNIVRGMGN